MLMINLKTVTVHAKHHKYDDRYCQSLESEQLLSQLLIHWSPHKIENDHIMCFPEERTSFDQ